MSPGIFYTRSLLCDGCLLLPRPDCAHSVSPGTVAGGSARDRDLERYPSPPAHPPVKASTSRSVVFFFFPPRCLSDVMELMFAEWEDGERFSFEDSDHFEEDSLCSFISEAESLCQNWRGWRKQSAGPNSPTVKMKGEITRCPRAVRWPCASCGVRGRCWAGRPAEVPAVQREVKRRLNCEANF